MANYGTIDLIAFSAKADILLKTGETITIKPEDISRYAPDTTMSSQCIPLGAAAATAYSFSFNNQGYGLTAEILDGAKVHGYISEGESESSKWKDFGVWYVDSVEDSEQDPFCTIGGSDALNSRFDAKWTDTKEDYPRSLLLIVRTMCAIADIELATTDFHNADYHVPKMPEWGEEATIRDVISCVAVCAAGFARMNYSGQLEIITIGKGTRHTANADYYSTYSAGGKFDFNCLQYKFETKADEEEADYTRFAVDSNETDNASNTIQLSGNPLITQEMANDIAQTLSGVRYEGASISWFGGADVLPGDELMLTTTDGKEHLLILTSYFIELMGGIASTAMSDMPSIMSQTEYFSSGVNAFNPDGTINAGAIAGLDKKVVSAEIGYFTNLTAENVKASKLLAAIIQATKLRADSIDANEIETDALTALAASIIEATIEKLKAGTIATDVLNAALGEITALKVESLTASDIETDRLAAALAAFTVITAGSADFDRATVEHLVSNLFNLTGSGVMEDVFIHNLKVAYAQMVSATIGNLVLKGKDGNYYEIDVNPDGKVTASLATVTEGEVNAGQTDGGKVIVATSMTVDDMNATTIKATHALVNKITAASIDTAELFANRAFIDQLTTSQIYSDTSLRMVIDEYGDVSKWFTFDAEKGLIIRKPEVVDEEGNVTQKKSIWSTVTDEKGYHVRSDEMLEPAGSFEGEGLTTPSVKIGEIRCKRTSTGGWVWTDA